MKLVTLSKSTGWWLFLHRIKNHIYIDVPSPTTNISLKIEKDLSINKYFSHNFQPYLTLILILICFIETK